MKLSLTARLASLVIAAVLLAPAVFSTLNQAAQIVA